MPRGIPIDRAALHRVLWRRSGRRHTLKVHQQMFAEELGISAYHLSRLIAELCRDGKARKLSTDKYFVGTYVIADPADFE